MCALPPTDRNSSFSTLFVSWRVCVCVCVRARACLPACINMPLIRRNTMTVWIWGFSAVSLSEELLKNFTLSAPHFPHSIFGFDFQACVCYKGWEQRPLTCTPLRAHPCPSLFSSLCSHLPAPPARESEMNLNWLRVKSSCRGRFSGAEAVAGAAVLVVGYRGRRGWRRGGWVAPVGCQGAARWLLGSAVAIGRALKPLGGLTIWKAGWVWQGRRWVLGG